MPEAKYYGEAAPRARDEQDFSSDPEARPPEALVHTLSRVTDLARLIQALRDVRHLLPPEGVAVVDRALGGTRFNADAPLFEPSDSDQNRPFN